jgi:hypothetical protein
VLHRDGGDVIITVVIAAAAAVTTIAVTVAVAAAIVVRPVHATQGSPGMTSFTLQMAHTPRMPKLVW